MELSKVSIRGSNESFHVIPVETYLIPFFGETINLSIPDLEDSSGMPLGPYMALLGESDVE
ncbi:MAG: hypothetical protein Q9215_001678 [Flavoplaca cf. flavocitrina]